MKFRIMLKKLEFIWHIVNLEDDTLAKEVMKVQKEHQLPGLVRECSEWIKLYNLPDILSVKLDKNEWKRLVKKAIYKENEENLRKKMLNYVKLKKSELISEHFGVQQYLKELNVHNARTIFKKRTSMTQYIKLNYSNDPRNVRSSWRCDSCQSCVDSMAHVLRCPSYAQLREEKDLGSNKDLANYLREVLLIRSKLEINM